MIKVDLITGFLGAGKSTFLTKYARYLMHKGLRIGILEYDFGAVNVDMVLLNPLRCDKCEIEMVAAACDMDCLQRRFRTKLIAMAMSGYDRVIIEPSGVFDMDMFYDALREPPLEDWYEIGNVITVVNATLREEATAEEDFLLASQALSSGCVLLSRVQNATAEQIEGTRQHLIRAAAAIGCPDFNPNILAKDWEEFSEEDFDRLSRCEYRIRDYVKQIAGRDVDFSGVCILSIEETMESMRRKLKLLFSGSEKGTNDTVCYEGEGDTLRVEKEVGERVAPNSAEMVTGGAISSGKSFGQILRVKGFFRDGGQNYQVNATAYEEQIEPVTIGQSLVIVIGSDLREEKIRALFA